ncbi:hypothetical protein SAMN04488005_0410 [Yoonia tamlensis]|uniref:PepSY domain-containing protein n=1 Tax=Yoonia tamlensis TaxID=390270 RepID=A0A1I6FSS8_9RHOB|nr:PepSY domain-containing protein [Yoonia tamlensis]SFR32973.1 hypothetical protein SAMN04488005_0410 [Yoonia tamlensis]
MTKDHHITRRAALARLGLGTAAAYMSPAFLGLSKAHAASSATAPSAASNPSPASDPTAPSPPTPPSTPSGPSQPSPTRASGPSSAGSCQHPPLLNGGQITRAEYAEAQAAIARGDARPLREVLTNVQSQHPGQLLRVGYAPNAGRPAYRVVIVNSRGAIISVTVDAGSGQITNVQNC